MKGTKCFTSKCAVTQRPFPPGVHGPLSRGKLTGFGIQLREKQKAKRVYGLLERQFRNYVDAASSTKGNTAEVLHQLLEMRLDNVVYRLQLSESRTRARQLVNHGHVLVNGRKLDIPSYQVRSNDVVTVDATFGKELEAQKERLAKIAPPSWLAFDAKNLKGTVISKPTVADSDHTFDITPIIEYYSR